MKKLFVLLFFLLFLIDLLVINFARKLLFDFLIGKKNNALKIHQQQKCKYRITMSYIKLYIKQNLYQFKVFHCIYLFELFTLIPQYIILLVSNIFIERYVHIPLIIFCVIKFLFFIVYWCQFDVNRVSRFK